MKINIILIMLLLLSSCNYINKWTENVIKDNKPESSEIENLSIDGIEYNINKIELIHKRWWKQTIYDKTLVLKEEPDFTEKYYIINKPQTTFSPYDNIEYYMQWWDVMLTKEQRDDYIQWKKERIKSIRVLSQWEKKYILYENSMSKLSDFEESWNITFNLGKYKTITIPK